MNSIKHLIILNICSLFLWSCQNQNKKQISHLSGQHDSLSIKSDTNKYVKSPYDTAALLKLLYPSLEIIGNVGYRKDTDDDFYHYYGTRVVSILSIQDDTIEHYAIVFATHPYVGMRNNTGWWTGLGVDMSIGMAELRKVGNRYKIGRFKKNMDSTGTSDYKPVISLEKFGANTYTINFSMEFGAGAGYGKNILYYQIPTGQKIFSYIAENDNYMTETIEFPFSYKTTRSLTILQPILPAFISPKYDDLMISSHSIKYDWQKHKKIEATTYEYYRMDTKKNSYQPLKEIK